MHRPALQNHLPPNFHKRIPKSAKRFQEGKQRGRKPLTPQNRDHRGRSSRGNSPLDRNLFPILHLKHHLPLKHNRVIQRYGPVHRTPLPRGKIRRAEYRSPRWATRDLVRDWGGEVPRV